MPGAIDRNVVTQRITASTVISNPRTEQVLANATGGAITVTVISRHGGMTHEVKVTKTDSSVNAVTVVAGLVSYVLSAQDEAVIVEQDDLGAFHAFASNVSAGTGTPGVVVADKIVVVDALKNISRFETIGVDALDMSSGTPVSHAINMQSMTLPPTSNAIRGAGVNPTRTSGWISFSGTISTTPAQCYTDYRELHTTGVAEVLGIGSFPFMDSGASCASMFALQAICEVDAGATVLTAAGAAGIGIFPITAKLLLNGETFNSGGVAAAMFLSVQWNVTDVSTQDVSAINVENASGTTKSLLHLTNTATGFTNLLWLPDDSLPAKSTQTNGGIQAGWIKVLIGSATRYIRLWDTPPT